MSERMFMVSESDLKEMLEAQMRLAALENGGVDNWEWIGDSVSDFLTEDFRMNKEAYIKFFNLKTEEEIEEFEADFGFSDIVAYLSAQYDEVK